MHKMVPQYFLTVALHHSAARQVRLQTVSQGSYSHILAGPLSCTQPCVNFMYASSLTELIHEILALFKLPQVLPLIPFRPRLHLMGLFTSEKLNTCPSVCKTEVPTAKTRHAVTFYLFLARLIYRIICFIFDFN